MYVTINPRSGAIRACPTWTAAVAEAMCGEAKVYKIPAEVFELVQDPKTKQVFFKGNEPAHLKEAPKAGPTVPPPAPAGDQGETPRAVVGPDVTEATPAGKPEPSRLPEEPR